MGPFKPMLVASDPSEGRRCASSSQEPPASSAGICSNRCGPTRSSNPDRCWADNLSGTRNLYDAIVRNRGASKPRILFASTGLIYGDPDHPAEPCTERTTLKPASPYACSKAAADLLSYQYTRTANLDIVRVRLFNQIGPRQSADYAVANFARQIAAIEAGQQESTIRTGPLDAERDVTDVRDLCSALAAIMARGTCGEAYNIGQGRTYPMREFLMRLVAMARVPVTVQSENSGRAGDTAIVRADVSRLQHLTGWAPQWTLDATLADILMDWRHRAGE